MAGVMTHDEIREALEATEAIRHGHFVLTSGRHSDTYVQCARILEDPALTTRLAQATVAKVPAGVDVDVVAAPAVGGIIIGFAVAQALGVRFIFSEREAGDMAFRRSFVLNPGSRVLVVEDVVTTGGSVAEVIGLLHGSDAGCAGVVSLIDRGGVKEFDAPYWPLLQLEVESWEPASCPLCAAGEQVTSPGSRRLSR